MESSCKILALLFMPYCGMGEVLSDLLIKIKLKIIKIELQKGTDDTVDAEIRRKRAFCHAGKRKVRNKRERDQVRIQRKGNLKMTYYKDLYSEIEI